MTTLKGHARKAYDHGFRDGLTATPPVQSSINYGGCPTLRCDLVKLIRDAAYGNGYLQGKYERMKRVS